MVNLLINGRKIDNREWKTVADIITHINSTTNLRSAEFYLEQEGKRLTDAGKIINESDGNINCMLRVCGGKGGFGSMLRAIGAQIEKTTNREACRDLSGRRLRDINEEKRLKAWLDKQEDREREEEERKKRKIEKLLAVPKHEFKDAAYEETRSKVTEKVNDAFEAGMKKSLETAASTSAKGTKRKIEEKPTDLKAKKNKQKKLWFDEDLSSDTDSDGSEVDNNPTKTIATT